MKKLSLFAIIAAISAPAMADDATTNAPTPDTAQATDAVAATTSENAEIVTQLAQIHETLNQMQSDMAAQNTVTQPRNTDEPIVISDRPTSVTNPETKFPRGMQIGVGLSATSGLNGFIGYENKKFDSFWWKRIGVRFDFATTKPLKSLINRMIDKVMGDDGIDIGDNLTINDGAIKAHHIAAMVDIYPFGDTWFLGGWRLSGGYYTGKLELSANLAGHLDEYGVTGDAIEFKLMDTQYRYNGGDVNGTARAKWNFSGPYVGTGFDLGLFAGIKIYLDAGVVFTNKAAELSLDAPVNDKLQVWNGTAWQNVDNATLTAAFEDAKRAALADAQDELDDIKFYPIVKLGFMYRF